MSLIAMRSAAPALLLFIAACAHARYHGREIGALSQLNHGVKGTVFAVDARTLFISDFHYDGVGPAAFFYVGSSGKPHANGATRLRDERGGTGPLRKYRGEGITVSLPDGITLRDVKWFSVWCDEYAVNFGDVSIPRDLEYPKPAKVGALRGVHGVSSDPVVVVDAQTLLVPNFSYDGEAPDAKFWVGRGDTPSPQGIRIPDENGKEAPLRKYDKKTVVLTLPGELTVFDIGHFAVWCEAFTVNFGHVVLPRAALANVPPSLKMLGVSPQSRNSALAASPQPPRAKAPSRHRPKIAKVDATTYRPALALAAGPRASPDHRPATHEHLHRRAYTNSQQQQQLVEVQPSKELKYAVVQQSEEDLYRQYQDQKAKLEELQRQYQLAQQQQQQYDQNQYKQHQYHQHSEEPQHQIDQGQLQYQQNQQYQQEQQQQTSEFHNQNQNQQQNIQIDRAAYERQLYERQLFEQQRIAHERQLLAQSQGEPLRYRLLPYSFEG